MRELRFDRVSVRYRKIHALRDASFVCEPGKVTCLAGPNGAGKSTALAAAAGVVAPGAGRISVGGAAVVPHRFDRNLAYLPQHSAFPALLTGREILRFALSATGAHQNNWHAALAVCGVGEIVDRRAGELSGGWTRRLGLAWTLLQPAGVLLLDEPLAGLDPGTLDRLIEHLDARACRGDTVVVTTHEFEALEPLKPALVVLDKGVVEARFPADGGTLREMYRSALKQPADPHAEAHHA